MGGFINGGSWGSSLFPSRTSRVVSFASVYIVESSVSLATTGAKPALNFKRKQTNLACPCPPGQLKHQLHLLAIHCLCNNLGRYPSLLRVLNPGTSVYVVAVRHWLVGRLGYVFKGLPHTSTGDELKQAVVRRKKYKICE